AQVMWQNVLRGGNPEEVKQWQAELEAVLDAEARRQQRKGDLAAVEYFRYHVQEIVPKSINNLLALFDLALDLEIFDPEELRLFVTLYAKSTDKMPRQHTSNPKIPKVSKAIASPFY
ncbi:MAG: hypothetical protein ACKO7A_13995, partial [Microcystis sp.]